MQRKGMLNKDVTKKECPWLDKDLKKGKVVYEYTGYTYGVIGRMGVAVSDQSGKGPFYEVPCSAITWDK